MDRSAMDDDGDVCVVCMDMPPGGGMLNDIHHAIIDDSHRTLRNRARVDWSVFALFVGGLFVVSMAMDGGRFERRVRVEYHPLRHSQCTL